MHNVLEEKGISRDAGTRRKPEVEVRHFHGKGGLAFDLIRCAPPETEGPHGERKGTALVRIRRGGTLEIHGRKRRVEAGELFLVPLEHLGTRARAGLDPLVAGAALLILLSLLRLAGLLS